MSQMNKCHMANCPMHFTEPYLMCRKHWTMLPSPLQAAITRQGRNGVDREYVRLVRRAVDIIQEKEAPKS